MPKKAAKPKKTSNLQADYDRLTQLGALPNRAQAGADAPRLNRPPMYVVVRNYTTYAAYEDPITEE